MDEICSFTINNHDYTIYNVRKIKGKVNYVGQSIYDKGRIYIEDNTFEQMLITLKHELMHVWLFENGHINQDEENVFNYEDLCELSALANNSINKIVNEYLKSYCKKI